MKTNTSNQFVKILLIAFVIVLITSVGLLAASCQCQHKYNSEVTKPASCSEVGVRTYTCSECGDSYTEEISKLPHTFLPDYVADSDGHSQKCKDCDFVTEKTAHEFTDLVSSEPSTCSKQGSVVKACVCGATDTELLPLAAHNYSKYVIKGDKHCLKCEVCGSVTAEEEDHKFEIQGEITPSTCTKQGSQVMSCVCGQTHSEALPLAPHTFTKSDFDGESHWTVCAVCGELDPDHPKTPHDLTVVTIEYCDKLGSRVTSCKECGHSHTEELSALGHDLNKTEFSRSATVSGHYYKCNRCGNDIVEPHTLVDCDCPEEGVGNKPATCYDDGHQAQQCTVCEKIVCHRVPKTDDHKWSEEWSSNGTFHWHACLNGDGKCVAKGSEEQHVWIEKSEPATCTENGREWRECKDCGHIQSGSNKVLKATGHDNEIIRTVTPATCTEAGEAEQRCKTCGATSTVAIKALGHTMSTYNMERTDVNGHYRQCSVCGFTNETPRGHTWQDKVEKEATCTSNGLTIRTCEFCKFAYEQITTKNHNYVTDPDSYVDATCTEYGTHVGICSECGDAQTFIDKHLGYAEHSLKYFPAKEMTETEAGNINYWQCQVCNKYFTSKDCHESLTEDQVFTYPPTLTRPDNIKQLIALALTLPENVVSEDYYQITATVYAKEASMRTLMLDDGDVIYATLIEKENILTINENDEITLKGNLIRSGDDVELVNCQIISVDCHDDELHSLFIKVSEDYANYINTYVGEEPFFSNTNNYNCILEGDEVTFYVYLYGEAVLQKLIINGKSYTMTDNMLTLTVTEDICIEFVVAAHNYCSATIREVDTSNRNGEAVIVDEYISYKYTGGYNDDGRLHKDSHLTFSVENANITGINITYDADWLTQHPNLLNNAVYAINAKGHKIEVEQGSANGNSQIKISLSAEDAYVALEYFANVYQARVVEITVWYQTYNISGM